MTRWVVTAMAATLILFLLLAARGTGGLPARLSRFGSMAVDLAERAQRFRHDMAGAARRPQIILQSAAVVTIYFLALTAMYRLFFEINGAAHPPFLTLLTAVTTASFLSNLPVSVNGLGLREQLHVLLLQPLGVPREAAVGISLLIFAHLLVSSLFGLLFWLRLPAMPVEDPKAQIPNAKSQVPIPNP
jgi:uncharacterized membrane protein YbhN (UPF0104 family)